MEKMCSGAYIGPVSLEVLKGAVKDGLFSDAFAKKIDSLSALSTIDVSAFLEAPYNKETLLGGFAAENATEADYDTLFQLLDAMAERSARYAASILAAAVIQSGEGTNASKPVGILCNGTTFYKTYNIFARVQGYLDEVLTSQRGLYWAILTAENDITLGTAIAGLIE
jgi:hexokinase